MLDLAGGEDGVEEGSAEHDESYGYAYYEKYDAMKIHEMSAEQYIIIHGYQ